MPRASCTFTCGWRPRSRPHGAHAPSERSHLIGDDTVVVKQPDGAIEPPPQVSPALAHMQQQEAHQLPISTRRLAHARFDIPNGRTR